MRPAIEVWTDAIDATGAFVRFKPNPSKAAAAIIEADRLEQHNATVREIVKHLIDDNGTCDCAAREESECACGGWDDYKRKPLLDVADEIERRFLK